MNIVRGQRIDFPRLPSGVLQTGVFHTVARGEDPNVTSWQVTLAPVFQGGITSALQGMPGQRIPLGATGGPVCRLTFGGGGVSFQTVFQWPVGGASFAVSGDNVMVEVMASDGATVFTAQDSPAVIGWLMPDAYPTAQAPIVVWTQAASAGVEPVLPWARYVLVAKLDPIETVLVEFMNAAGVLSSAQLTAPTSLLRLPMHPGATRVRVTPSVSVAAQVGQELAFT